MSRKLLLLLAAHDYMAALASMSICVMLRLSAETEHGLFSVNEGTLQGVHLLASENNIGWKSCVTFVNSQSRLCSTQSRLG